ncbi:hypothetical protein P364_0130205 [Paenibacillus sp. MAEPY2]|nr:hypothetical protein P364_0130205 [Paenibacillus sp. MAEPY2]KGP89351.1 hypothetical protein P363_0101445 [Paenibacillus sp. MAEPY1]OZQ71101.1 hypothetical protein CA599_11245 [Paenibacillus taichungensis]
MSITHDLQQSVSTFLTPLFEKMYSHDVTHSGSSDVKELLEVEVQETDNKPYAYSCPEVTDLPHRQTNSSV